MHAFVAADALGPMEFLINNAGIVGSVGRLDAVTGPVLEVLARTNDVGAFPRGAIHA